MNYRTLGQTGFNISEISLGTWQVGGGWGRPFDDKTADAILHTAIDAGVNFLDTADVYDDGRSEQAVGRVVRERSERIYVATKCGRKINPHVSDGYQPAVLRKFVEDSLRRLGLEQIDLIQLHCPPTEVYYRPEIFELFERLREEGKIGHLGVSVEKVEEALKAIEYGNVATVQIIFNMFRQRPAGLFFREASRRKVGVIVRVPLASGLLTGKFDRSSDFADGDHRHFNRKGEAFDRGETFAGVDFETGLAAVSELRRLFPGEETLAPAALRWILDHEAVSCIIPGASRPSQVTANAQASALPPLNETQRQEVARIYRTYVRDQVHHRW